MITNPHKFKQTVQENLRRIECEMSADYSSSRPAPTSLESALVEINLFPKELKDASRPRRFHCTPLRLIGPKPEVVLFCRELSDELVTRSREQINQFGDYLLRLKDMCEELKQSPISAFKNLQKQRRTGSQRARRKNCAWLGGAS